MTTENESDRTSPGWTQEALARVAQLQGRLALIDEEEQRDRVAATLQRAQDILDQPVPHKLGARLANWWNGDHIERTWTWLEQAEVDLVEYSNDRGIEVALAIALQRVAKVLPTTDPRRQDLDALAKSRQPESGDSR